MGGVIEPCLFVGFTYENAYTTLEEIIVIYTC